MFKNQIPLSNNIREPSSSKSFLLIHILLNAFKLETVAPPIQQENLLFLGAMSVIVQSLLTNFPILLWSLSLNPVNNEVPPATTIELYKVFLISISHFLMEFTIISCTPGHSSPILSGLKRISGALNFSEESYMT